MTALALIPPERVLDETWKRLSAGAGDRAHPMRLVTLATATVSGRPSARMMVIRGADRSSRRIWFHTDRRSSKIEDLSAMPHACLVAYDGRDGVEIRLEGAVSLHSGDQAAAHHWEQTSLALQYLDSSPDPPGMQVQQDPRLPHTLQAITEGMAAQARRNFVVIELEVELIDWFQTLQVGQNRVMLHVMSGWRPEVICP
jgi:pyridoxamine 5'-phosphate oxidase